MYAYHGLTCNGATLAAAQQKAEMLGDHFSNQAMPPLSPVEHPRNDTELHNTLEDFLCCVEEIYNYLSNLDTSKANGPDGIISLNA